MNIESRGDANGAPLQAGLAKVEITPLVGQPMGGYGARLKVDGGAAVGIHDPLFARVVILASPDVSVALVALDLLLFSSAKVVAEAKRKWGLDHVILSSTHTHSGPIPTTGGMPSWSDLNVSPDETLDFSAFSEDPWYAATEEKVIAAIGEAMGNLFPARIGAEQRTSPESDLGHNRRHVGPDGKVKMVWSNPDRMPTGTNDPTVGVIRIDDDAGRTRAILVNFACHGVVLGSENREISADFPGAMAAHIEQEMGPDCLGLFLQGAEGDVDPYECIMPGTDEAFRIVKETGDKLAAAALAIAREIEPAPIDESPILAEKRLVTIPHRRDDGASDVALTTVVIGKHLALVAIPSEPFVQHQINLRDKSPVKNTLLLGLAYSGEGVPFTIYLPTRQAAGEGGYGADNTTFLEIGAGERLVEEAVASIRELIAGGRNSQEIP